MGLLYLMGSVFCINVPDRAALVLYYFLQTDPEKSGRKSRLLPILVLQFLT